jgi:hypothetical protein
MNYQTQLEGRVVLDQRVLNIKNKDMQIQMNDREFINWVVGYVSAFTGNSVPNNEQWSLLKDVVLSKAKMDSNRSEVKHNVF